MSGLQARRATIDDLPALRGLWSANHLPVPDLEKRVTEFQLVENEAGELLGAAALHMEAHQGKMHSFALEAKEDEPQARLMLWERLEAVAKNNGLVRLWQPLSPCLHKAQGFEPPTAENVRKAPHSFQVDANKWLTLKLREETAAAALSLDKEFALFAESQRVETERMIEQGRKLRGFAYTLALLVLFGALGLFFFAFKTQPKLRPWNKNQPDTRASVTNLPSPATNAPSR